MAPAGLAASGTTTSLSRIGANVAVPAGTTRIAAPAAGSKLTLDVTLTPRNESALAAFVRAVNTKGDPEYHHFLSKGQFAEYFGPTQAAVTAVEYALKSRGLTVGTVSSDDLSIPVTTTVAGAEAAFGTSINGYRLADGTTGFANTLAPELPSSVAGDVSGIVGLSDLAKQSADHVVRSRTTTAHAAKAGPAIVKPAVVSGEPTLCSSAESSIANNPNFGGATDTNGYYSAQSLSAAYGLTNLYSSNEYGSGTSIGLFELDAYIGSDITAYQSCYGTSAKVTNIPVDGGPSGKYITGESELDIEDLASLAPKANILVYQGPDANATTTTDANVLDTYRRMVTDDNAQVLSLSWGGCETLTATDSTFMSSADTIWQEAVAQGQSVFVAAGDEGSTTCYGEGGTASQSTMVDADYPASSPYVTGVGGTTLPSGSPGTSGSTVWNPGSYECIDSSGNITTCDGGAGGGGVSRYEQLSSSGYQSGVSGPGYSNLCSAASGSVCRQVPDVSASADEFQGYPVYLGGQWGIIGGTSAATPTWAATLADIESSATCALNGTGLGEINPQLYAAAANSTTYANDFADVTQGNNDDLFTGYTGGLYASGTGYDMASGLGQPQAGGLQSTFCASTLTSSTTFTAAGPSRVLDTRKAIGVTTTTPVPAGGIVSLNVYGSAGVPAGTTATAVVLNVTVTNTTSGGYLTVYPNGKTITSGSNLNWVPNTTIANLVTVPVGAGGKVEFKNTSGGTVAIVADLFGYYTSGAGASYTPESPTRILDTRKAIGVTTTTPVPAGGTVVLKVAGMGGVPASGATAVVLNVTVTGGTGSGYLTVYPGNDTSVPTGSNLNWTTGETLPNLVTVPLDSSGDIQLHNTSGGTVHIVGDLEGYYSSTGSTFTAAGPERVLDTRNATGVGTTTAVPSGGTVVLTVAGVGGVPTGIKAAFLNVTVTGGSGNGYLTVYPDGVTLPIASNVNWSTGETIPNAVLVSVGSDGRVDFHNTSGGTVHIVSDLFGYFG